MENRFNERKVIEKFIFMYKTLINTRVDGLNNNLWFWDTNEHIFSLLCYFRIENKCNQLDKHY